MILAGADRRGGVDPQQLFVLAVETDFKRGAGAVRTDVEPQVKGDILGRESMADTLVGAVTDIGAAVADRGRALKCDTAVVKTQAYVGPAETGPKGEMGCPAIEFEKISMGKRDLQGGAGACGCGHRRRFRNVLLGPEGRRREAQHKQRLDGVEHDMSLCTRGGREQGNTSSDIGEAALFMV